MNPKSLKKAISRPNNQPSHLYYIKWLDLYKSIPHGKNQRRIEITKAFVSFFVAI